MKAIYYLKRAFSLPPKVTLQKVIYKLQKLYIAKKKSYIDRKFSTYCGNKVDRLNLYIRSIHLDQIPREKILSLCEHFQNHEFDLLGSGWVQVSSGKIEINSPNLNESNRIQGLIAPSYCPIDWQLDFKSGYRWSGAVRSEEIQYGVHLGVDVKVPWELARMQHLPQLALGFGIQKNEKYSFEFRNQILDFIAGNPPRYGVNWSCTMDVGIRIANMLMAYDLFRCFGAQFDPDFASIFFRSVYEHGQHIITHLEWDPHLRSNHYLANIAGLLFVAAYLPSSSEVDSWFDFAVHELIQEVMIQFHPDGSNFEASTSYHRLSAEMVLYATALGMERGAQFPEEYLGRIVKMGEFIHDITKPDGTIVQMGDNDSGRFAKFFPDSNLLDHCYLLPAFQNLKGLQRLIEDQFERVVIAPKMLVAYPDFGLYLQNVGPWNMAIRCGSIGQKGNGGHAHNDQLSFELSVRGISMLIDPGTYVYTPFPKERRLFRSTALHNTLVVEGKEQNLDEGLFKMTDKAQARVILFEKGVFVGEHRGFGATHLRTLKIKGDGIEGIDECESDEVKKIYFHFAPGWKGSGEIWEYQDVRVRFSSDQGEWQSKEGLYSGEYGKKESTSVLILNTPTKRISWKILLL